MLIRKFRNSVQYVPFEFIPNYIIKIYNSFHINDMLISLYNVERWSKYEIKLKYKATVNEIKDVILKFLKYPMEDQIITSKNGLVSDGRRNFEKNYKLFLFLILKILENMCFLNFL
jgi:hypothetical protein